MCSLILKGAVPTVYRLCTSSHVARCFGAAPSCLARRVTMWAGAAWVAADATQDSQDQNCQVNHNHDFAVDLGRVYYLFSSCTLVGTNLHAHPHTHTHTHTYMCILCVYLFILHVISLCRVAEVAMNHSPRARDESTSSKVLDLNRNRVADPGSEADCQLVDKQTWRALQEQESDAWPKWCPWVAAEKLCAGNLLSRYWSCLP